MHRLLCVTTCSNDISKTKNKVIYAAGDTHTHTHTHTHRAGGIWSVCCCHSACQCLWNIFQPNNVTFSSLLVKLLSIKTVETYDVYVSAFKLKISIISHPVCWFSQMYCNSWYKNPPGAKGSHSCSTYIQALRRDPPPPLNPRWASSLLWGISCWDSDGTSGELKARFGCKKKSEDWTRSRVATV